MFKFNELSQVHLEISNNCQASCPMCTRNIHGGVENPLIQIESWTLERYKKIINLDVLSQIRALYFCGNYGDPLLNNSLLAMVKYSVNVNPNIEIRIHTNGSLRSTKWWTELAHALPDNHKVIFAIDGLSDTHRLYRIGTDYHKILANATAFIKAGGRAEWAFIRFKHNEHQIDEAKNIAKQLKFEEFTMKDSSRFLLDGTFPVYNKDRETLYHLQSSQYSEIKFIDKKVLDNYKNIVATAKIDCHAIRQKEVYINAQGHVFPCCWLAMVPYQPQDELSELLPVRTEMLKQYHELVESLGGINSLSAETYSVKEIINSNAYQSVWNLYWGEKKLITCVRTCGVVPELFSTPQDQFTTNEVLTNLQ